MNRYVIGDAASGEILRSVTCTEDQLVTQVKAGEVLDLHDDATDATHYFLAGEVVAYTQTQAETKARRRGNAVWSNASMSWQELRSLDEVKREKTIELNLARARNNGTFFSYQGKDIAVDQLSRSDIDAVANYVGMTGNLPPDFPGAWKAIDNTYVLLPTPAIFINFYEAMVKQGTANFIRSEQRKAALAAATTVVQVEAITW